MGRGRAPCCDKSKVRTGPWSPAEDLRLINFIQKNGHSNWRALPKQAGLLRCGKSCRLRWINYLRPDVKRGNFTAEEENTIIRLHNSIGNKWSKIASCLPGRTDNEIKNVWNTHLKKRLINKSPPNSNIYLETSSSSSSSSDKKLGSPSPSSCASNNATNQEEALMVVGSENHDLMKTTSDSDVDFWEVLESLDPVQFAVAGEENLSMIISGVEGKVDGEVGEWLRNLENELGLADDVDGDHQPEYETSSLQLSTPSCPSSPAHHFLGI